jgi:hypothetical protein
VAVIEWPNSSVSSFPRSLGHPHNRHGRRGRSLPSWHRGDIGPAGNVGKFFDRITIIRITDRNLKRHPSIFPFCLVILLSVSKMHLFKLTSLASPLRGR